jgi:GT2 family glycosyltransferase
VRAPKLVVVIVSWNTAAETRACLRTLSSALDGIDHEVWVVDNASSDDSVAMIAGSFPEARLIRNDANVGFAKANNQALRASRSEYCLLLNSDTLLPKASISSLVDYLDAHQDVTAVGPVLVTGDGHEQYLPKRLPSFRSELQDMLLWHFPPLSRILRRAAGRTGRRWWPSAAPTQVELLSMACMMIRRDAFDRIGFLGEDYFLFSEENDFFTRMRGAGLKSHLLPQVSVTHLGGKSRGKLQRCSDEYYYESRLTFFSVHRPGSVRLVRWAYLAFFGWSYLVSALMGLLKGRRGGVGEVYYGKVFHAVLTRRLPKDHDIPQDRAATSRR